jgi:hypothetical protein
MGSFADSFQHIKDRDSFYATLDKAIAASEARPDDPGFARVASQLRAIKGWTKGGEQPSREDIESIDICRIVAVEYEALRSEIQEVDDWAQMAGEVAIYIKHWLDDAEFAEVDEYDLEWY